MPLNAEATAAQHLAGFEYVAGDAPRTIELWDAEAEEVVGDPITVLWNGRTVDVEAVPAGLLVDEELPLFTAEPLEPGLTYLYDLAVYTVEQVDPATVGTFGVQSRAILRRKAE